MTVSKVLIVGKGFIGHHLANFLAGDTNFEVHAISYEQINYRDNNILTEFIEEYRGNGVEFDALINCAGFTGKKNVDDAEKEKELVWLLNAVLPVTLASVAQACNIPSFINISSGCIFTGYDDDNGYTEDKIPNFGLFDEDSSFYSKTKHAGELSLTSSFNCYNIRIRMPIAEMYHPKNIISKMLTYKKILLEKNSATYLFDLFNFIYNMVLLPPPFGIYNVVSSGIFSADNLFKAFDNNKEALIKEELLPKNWDLKNIEFLGEKEFYKNKITVAKRSNCLLSNETAEGLKLHTFTTIDDEFLDKMIKAYIEDKQAKQAPPENVIDIPSEENT